jgi:hypothetical protein
MILRFSPLSQHAMKLGKVALFSGTLNSKETSHRADLPIKYFEGSDRTHSASTGTQLVCSVYGPFTCLGMKMVRLTTLSASRNMLELQ